MNSRKLLLLVVFALAAAAGSVFIFSNMLARQPQPTNSAAVAPRPDPSPTSRIMVAAVDLPAGTLLASNSLTWRAWPKEGVDGRLYFPEGSETIETQVGKVIRAGVRAGDPLVRANIIGKGESGFLAAVLSPGMRAIAVSVNAVAGVGGFVFPGDRVDVILSHDVQLPRADGTAGLAVHKVSETIMRGVRVVAVDQRSSDQETRPTVSSVVTLEVSPPDAERVALASQMGEIRLSLRSIKQDEPVAADAAGGGGVLLGEGRSFSLEAEGEVHSLTIDSDLSRIIAPPLSSGGDSNAAKSTAGRVTVIRANTSSVVEAR